MNRRQARVQELVPSIGENMDCIHLFKEVPILLDLNQEKSLDDVQS